MFFCHGCAIGSVTKLLIVLAICFIGIGFCLGWFSLSRSTPSPDQANNKVNINVSVDRGKMKSDIKKAEEEVKEEIVELEGKKPPKAAASEVNRWTTKNCMTGDVRIWQNCLSNMCVAAFRWRPRKSTSCCESSVMPFPKSTASWTLGAETEFLVERF